MGKYVRSKGSIVIGIAIICLLLSGVVYAASSIQLVVNGKTIASDVSPLMKDGRTMVPIRWVAEALGAEVTWDNESKTVTITTNADDTSADGQIALLHQGLKAQTPQEAAETWMNAVQNRNGAVQYAMLAPALKERTRSHYESIHWVTGISSPYVSEAHRIEQEIEEHTWQFSIEFQMMTSTGPAGLQTATITVEQIEQHWYITEVLGGTLGVPNIIPDDIRTDDEEIRAVIESLELGIGQAEVRSLFGDEYVEVLGAKDGQLMWRYDDIVDEVYVVEDVSFDGGKTYTDSVDREGLETGSLRMQMFISWNANHMVDSYSLLYKGHDDEFVHYGLFADGKIFVK